MLNIPNQFLDGLPVDQLLLVCDVDGVVRQGIDQHADPRVIASIKELILHGGVDVAFISGSPVVQDTFLEAWRGGNVTLDRAIAGSFLSELKKNKVTIYGALGGQRMNSKQKIEILDSYPFELIFEICKLLIEAFLLEVDHDGSPIQKEIARGLYSCLRNLRLLNYHQTFNATPLEFEEIVSVIRTHLDSDFRLISHGAFIESQTSYPQWKTERSLKWLHNKLSSKECPYQKDLGTGLAYRGNTCFNFLAISKVNKSQSITMHVKEKISDYPNALVVTIGDSPVDFPMHQHAHIAYHVGSEDVWKSYMMPNCLLVQDVNGRDRQHVNGTLQVLEIIKKGIGKPIKEWEVFSNVLSHSPVKICS